MHRVWGGAGVLLAMAAFCGAAALLAYTFNKMPEHPAIIAPQPASAAGVSDDDDMALQKQQQEGCAPVQEGVTTAAAAGPAAGITIAFKDLCYYVPSSSGKGSELQLLHNITGCFRPGVLSALMGSSGASLMRCMLCVCLSASHAVHTSCCCFAPAASVQVRARQLRWT